MAPQPDFSPEKIKRSIEDTSGYPFELQIAQRVSKWNEYAYFVEPNYSFEDHDTGKARELDFHALRASPISARKGEYTFTVLLGSCKANKNPFIFFTREEPLAGLTMMSDVPISGCPLEIFDKKGESDAIELYFRLREFLHIAKLGIISSQFCVLNWRSSKWDVQPQAVIRDTLIPLMKVMSREIEQHNEKCSSHKGKILPEYHIYYPLLVLNGPLYEYYVPPEGPAQLREVKHVLVIRHYESKTVKCRYAIDVIHETYLEQYLELIEEEVSKYNSLVRRHKKRVLRSIKELAAIEEAGAKEKGESGK